MSDKREFPILNGKLLSDLDANGHKIIGLDPEYFGKLIKDLISVFLNTKVDKIPGKGLSSNDYTDEEKNKLAGIEAGAEKNPDLSGYATKDFVESKINDLDCSKDIARLESSINGIQIGVNHALTVSNTVQYQADATDQYVFGTVDPKIEELKNKKVSLYGFHEPRLETGRDDKTCVLIRPFSCNELQPSSGGGAATDVAFYVEIENVSESNNYDGCIRDMVFVVDCDTVETAPKIEWPGNCHPRTDAETDFKCEAGKRNVYWISEYAQGKFVVAGWQETEGGNAV
jgi:hypothetical protein